MNFYETRMGNEFYQGTMPRLAQNTERIADALEVLAEKFEKKEESNEKWITFRMSGFDRRGACEFNKLSRKDERFFPSDDAAKQMMLTDISKILSKYTGKTLPYDSEDTSKCLITEGLDIQVGDHAAELYRGDTVVYCWKVMRVA